MKEILDNIFIGAIVSPLNLIFVEFFIIQRVNRIMKCDCGRVQQHLLQVPLI